MNKSLKEILKENLSFLVPFAIVWVAALAFALMHTKAETHMIINGYNAHWADLFFKYLTHVGGAIPWIIIAVVLFYRYRVALFLMASQVVTTVFIYALKHIFAVPRPSVLLNRLGYTFHTVEGVSLHSSLSFPSGHTAAAFALMFAISILCKHNWQRVLCLAIAVLTGFSRIYLSQHFLEDVLAGSVVGILSTLLVYFITIKATKAKHKTTTLAA